MEDNVRKAYELAIKSRENSHSPYSKFKVGACFKVQGENHFFSGTNMENASFPAGICAERTALGSAISHGKKKFELCVIVTDTKSFTAPCGVCRQTMVEFCDPDMPVYLANLDGEVQSYLLKELLPHSFTSFS